MEIGTRYKNVLFGVKLEQSALTGFADIRSCVIRTVDITFYEDRNLSWRRVKSSNIFVSLVGWYCTVFIASVLVLQI